MVKALLICNNKRLRKIQKKGIVNALGQEFFE